MAHISLERDGATVAITGDTSATLGHRLLLPNGTIDGVHASWCWKHSRLLFEADRYRVSGRTDGLWYIALAFYLSRSPKSPTSRLEGILRAGARRTLRTIYRRAPPSS